MGSAVEKRLGKQIAHYRAVCGYTQEQLAEKLDVATETISRLERGVSIPSLKTLEELARIFRIGLHELFDFRDLKNSNDKAIDSLIRDLKTRPTEDVDFVRRLASQIFNYFQKS